MQRLVRITCEEVFLRYYPELKVPQYIKVVAFEDYTKLAYHKIDTVGRHIIGLNKTLLYKANEKVIKDIVKHELAHAITFLTYGSNVDTHGKEFKYICKKLGAKPDSTADLEKENHLLKDDEEVDKLISKVKKLLQLSSSDNENESELATLKANQLLLKHNLKHQHLHNDKEEIYTVELFHCKRMTTKMKVIADILETFNAYPVKNRLNNHSFYTFSGTKASIEIIEYIADFLDHEIERLWKKAKKENKLKGNTARNSFLRGIYMGYKEKLDKINNDRSKKENNSIIKYEHKLKEKIVDLVYYNSRLSTSYSRYREDSNASNIGKKVGSKLSINKAVRNENKNNKKYISD